MKLHKLSRRDEKLLKGVKSGRSVKLRVCLMCREEFLSNGPGNRRCTCCERECENSRTLRSGCVDLVPHMLGRDHH